MLFHGIAVKPGKPTAFGRVARQAVLRHARLSDVVPVERATSCSCRRCAASRGCRRTRSRPSRCRSRGACVSTTDRHQFYTVRIADGAAVPAFKASGDITSMSQADGYFEIAADTDVVEQGELVEVTLFLSVESQREVADNIGVAIARRHISLCCDQDEAEVLRQGTQPRRAWNFLKRRLKELQLSEQGGILRTKANCLRICEGGPIAVVHSGRCLVAVPVIRRFSNGLSRNISSRAASLNEYLITSSSARHAARKHRRRRRARINVRSDLRARNFFSLHTEIIHETAKSGCCSFCLAALPVVALAQGSVDGKWAGEVPGGRGPQMVSLTLKADGGKLTGSIAGGRGGESPDRGRHDRQRDAEVQDRSRWDAAARSTLNWSGTLKGDEIAFTRMAERRPGSARGVHAEAGEDQRSKRGGSESDPIPDPYRDLFTSAQFTTFHHAPM